MNVTIEISRHANLFHFVNNLAAWHFSCRRHYNQAWLDETGAWTPLEKNALDGFTALAREYPYGEQWLGRAIIPARTEAEAHENLVRMLGTAKADRLWSCLAAFEHRFGRIWTQDQNGLKPVSRSSVRLWPAARSLEPPGSWKSTLELISLP